MIRTTVLVLIFLSAADICANDSKYCSTAVQISGHIYHHFVGR